MKQLKTVYVCDHCEEEIENKYEIETIRVMEKDGSIHEMDVCDGCRDSYTHCDGCTSDIYIHADNINEFYLYESIRNDDVHLCPHCLAEDIKDLEAEIARAREFMAERWNRQHAE